MASCKEKVGSNAFETTFTHDVENRPTQLRFGDDNRKVTYAYDPIGRISSTATSIAETPYTTTYGYIPYSDDDNIRTTPLVKTIT